MKSKFYTYRGLDFFFDDEDCHEPYLVEMREGQYRFVSDDSPGKWLSSEYYLKVFSEAVDNGSWVERENPWA